MTQTVLVKPVTGCSLAFDVAVLNKHTNQTEHNHHTLVSNTGRKASSEFKKKKNSIAGSNGKIRT